MSDTPSVAITAKLSGGIGNQMFQIAAAYGTAHMLQAIPQTQPVRCVFITNQFDGCSQGLHPTTYYSTIYSKIPFVPSLPEQRLVHEKSWSAQPILDDVRAALTTEPIPQTLVLRGLFQSDVYFKDHASKIKDLFTPVGGIMHFVSTQSTVVKKFPELAHPHSFGCIGIRRGDYLANPHVHNPCGMTYYTEAMKRMNCERYYIVSDDYAWAKKNFIGDTFRFLELDTDLEEPYAMALFNYYILSNSTFQWWGSFLSIYTTPRIIVPDKWIEIPGYETIYRSEMEIITRPVETV